MSQFTLPTYRIGLTSDGLCIRHYAIFGVEPQEGFQIKKASRIGQPAERGLIEGKLTKRKKPYAKLRRVPVRFEPATGAEVDAVHGPTEAELEEDVVLQDLTLRAKLTAKRTTWHYMCRSGEYARVFNMNLVEVAAMRQMLVCLFVLCLFQWAGWSAESHEKPLNGEVTGASKDSGPVGSVPDKGASDRQGGELQDISEVRKAAEQGDADAQCNMGIYYSMGKGVPQDNVEAVKWFRRAAEQGDPVGQYNLGTCYRSGEGVPYDIGEAINWYRKAAEQGHSKAQFNLGLCYVKGEGVPKDTAEAVKCYREAAEQGLAEAQFNLGCCYVEGEGVPKDDVEAVKWCREAAEQGLGEAQFSLGRCYAGGQGVGRDLVEAVKWLFRAAGNGSKKAVDYISGVFSLVLLLVVLPVPLTLALRSLARREMRLFLRWVTLLPAVVLCYLFLTPIVDIMNTSILSRTWISPDWPLPHILIRLMANFAGTAGAVYAAYAVAPSHNRIITTLVSGMLFLLSCTTIPIVLCERNYWAIFESIGALLGVITIFLALLEQEKKRSIPVE